MNSDYTRPENKDLAESGIKIFTGGFFQNGRDPRAVSISRGKPPWYSGKMYDLLAPQYPWLKLPIEKYNEHYSELLSNLNARHVVEEMADLFGPEVIMLCWEPFNVSCHRRFVAEWIERETGLIVPEYNHEREESIPYLEMPTKDEAKKAKADAGKAEVKKDRGQRGFQFSLF